jgi:hypothetical protein
MPENIPEMIEHFADHPKTIGQHRSDRTQLCSDWEPRDALIELLRRIDRGEIDPDSMVICWREINPDGSQQGHFLQATPDVFVTLGLLSRTAYQIQAGT